MKADKIKEILFKASQDESFVKKYCEQEFSKAEAKELFEKNEKYKEDLYNAVYNDILNNVDIPAIKLKYGTSGVFMIMKIFADNKIPVSPYLEKLFYDKGFSYYYDFKADELSEKKEIAKLKDKYINLILFMTYIFALLNLETILDIFF